jgi:hypothetical protein
LSADKLSADKLSADKLSAGELLLYHKFIYNGFWGEVCTKFERKKLPEKFSLIWIFVKSIPEDQVGVNKVLKELESGLTTISKGAEKLMEVIFATYYVKGYLHEATNCHVEQCRGLSRLVAACRGLSRLVAACRGLSRLVAACRGLSRPY